MKSLHVIVKKEAPLDKEIWNELAFKNSNYEQSTYSKGLIKYYNLTPYYIHVFNILTVLLYKRENMSNVLLCFFLIFNIYIFISSSELFI